MKPFVICTANGRIIDVYGPYPAKANDASILEHILRTNQDLKSLLKVRINFFLQITLALNIKTKKICLAKRFVYC